MSRVGNFSSSEIWKLMTNGRKKGSVGKPAETYIQEKVYERKLKRSLHQKQNSRSTTWGTFVEKHVFDLIGLNYKLVSKERYVHPWLKCWTGMPDLISRDQKVVGDIKCPWTLKSFCELVEIVNKGPEALKESKPEYYWQLVSNSILTGINTAELIIYMPYKSELQEIKDKANDHSWDGVLTENDVAFINFASDQELPYILEDSSYKNINTLRFDINAEDADELSERVGYSSAKLSEAI